MSNRFQNWQHWLTTLTSFVITGLLFLYAYVGFYSRFIADDYCSAALAQRLGVLRATWFWYLNWTGRYSASALDSIAGLLGPKAASFYPLLALITWLALIFLSVKSVLRFSFRPVLLAVSCGLVILGSTLIAAPTLVQSLYWGQGMRSVIPPLILGTAYIPLFQLLRKREWNKLQSCLWCALSFALALAAGGFSETYAALQVVMYGLAVVLYLLNVRWASLRRVEFLSLGFALLGSLLALMLVIAAPGNKFRQDLSPTPLDWITIAQIALQSFGNFLVYLFSTVDKLLVLLGVTGFALSLGMSGSTEGRVKPEQIMFLFVTGIGLIFVCFPPAAYGLGEAPPDRTQLIPTYLLVLTLFFTGYLTGQLVSPVFSSPRRVSALMVSAFFLICASVGISFHRSASSLPAYIGYAAYWDQTHAEILAARESNLKNITVHSERNWAGLNDAGDNPKFWVNVCMSEYYGIDILADNTGMQPGNFIP